MYYIYNKSSTYRGQYRAEERNRNSQNLNCGHCRNKINLLNGVRMVGRLRCAEMDMRVRNRLAVNRMLVGEQCCTDNMLHKNQKHKCRKKPFRYILYVYHLHRQK